MFFNPNIYIINMRPKREPYERTPTHRVVMTVNDKYRKTLSRCKSLKEGYKAFRKHIKVGEKVIFPKKYVNNKKVEKVEYKIYLVKDKENETPNNKLFEDWDIVEENPYNLEEDFYIYGNKNIRFNRPKIGVIIKALLKGIDEPHMIKQVIVVHNKLVIYNESYFYMVICKNLEDAQRLHHTLYTIINEREITNVIFSGTASPATVQYMYDMIHDETGWSMKKIRRYNSRSN